MAGGTCGGYFVSDAIFNYETLDVSGEEDSTSFSAGPATTACG